jgi:drug/metabolite transporter (DMT)-like permease
MATTPLLIPVVAYYFFREKTTFGNYIGIVLSIIGVFLVIHADKDTNESTFKGIILMMGSVLSTIGFSVSVKRLVKKYDPFTIIVYQNLIGFLFYLAVFIGTGSRYHEMANLNQKTLIPLLNLALFGSGLAFIFFIYSVKKIGIAKTNVFTNLIPVFTAISAYFILDEKFTAIKMLGILVVLSGLILSQLKFNVNKK